MRLCRLFRKIIRIPSSRKMMKQGIVFHSGSLADAVSNPVQCPGPRWVGFLFSRGEANDRFLKSWPKYEPKRRIGGNERQNIGQEEESTVNNIKNTEQKREGGYRSEREALIMDSTQSINKNAVIYNQKSPYLTCNTTNCYYLLCIQLSSPITFKDQAQPVALPKQLEPTEGGTPATVIGWGFPYVSTLL